VVARISEWKQGRGVRDGNVSVFLQVAIFCKCRFEGRVIIHMLNNISNFSEKLVAFASATWKAG